MVAPRHLGVHPKEDARGNAATLSRVSVAQRIACAIFIERPDGRVVSCRNAKCCARAKGLVELIIARNGNQVANNHAYRLRAHSTPEWMTSSCGRPASRWAWRGLI